MEEIIQVKDLIIRNLFEILTFIFGAAGSGYGLYTWSERRKMDKATVRTKEANAELEEITVQLQKIKLNDTALSSASIIIDLLSKGIEAQKKHSDSLEERINILTSQMDKERKDCNKKIEGLKTEVRKLRNGN